MVTTRASCRIGSPAARPDSPALLVDQFRQRRISRFGYGRSRSYSHGRNSLRTRSSARANAGPQVATNVAIKEIVDNGAHLQAVNTDGKITELSLQQDNISFPTLAVGATVTIAIEADQIPGRPQAVLACRAAAPHRENPLAPVLTDLACITRRARFCYLFGSTGRHRPPERTAILPKNAGESSIARPSHHPYTSLYS